MDPFEADINRAITQLTEVERAVARAMPKGAAAGARVLLAAAERRAPRRTGELAASGFEEPVENDTTGASHRVGFRKFYALPVDRGHPVRSGKTGKIVGRAAPAMFLSGPVQTMRKGRVAKAVTEAVDREVRVVWLRYNRR